MNVCQTTIVEDVWARGQELTVHGIVYGLHDGLLRDLGVSASSLEEREQPADRDAAGRGRARRRAGHERPYEKTLTSR